MNDEELDRLATLIAEALLRELDAGDESSAAPPKSRAAPWLVAPVRPSPSPRSNNPPVWSAAALELTEVAAGKTRGAPRHRTRTADSTADIRAAAAGRKPMAERKSASRALDARRSTLDANHGPPSRRRVRAFPIEVKLGISRRHLHLSADDQRALFGDVQLTPARQLSQPGQFAATQTVTVVGPKGELPSVRVVGPSRGETQLELAASDAAALGVAPPVAASGRLDASAGGVTLVGPFGRLTLNRGVIIAGRHLHLAPADAERWGLRDGDVLDVRSGTGARETTFHGILVRSGPAHATELHLDDDEARAAGIESGAVVRIVGWQSTGLARRPLVTERDILRLARERQPIPANALLTPGARDRAHTLGLLER